MKSSAAAFNTDYQDCTKTRKSAFYVTVFYRKKTSKLYDLNYVKICIAKTIGENSVCQNLHRGYPRIVRLDVHFSSSFYLLYFPGFLQVKFLVLLFRLQCSCPIFGAQETHKRGK